MFKIDPYQYFFVTPLYTKFVIEHDGLNEFLDILYFKGSINAYNVSLKENTTYAISPNSSKSGLSSMRDHTGLVTHTLKCTRTGECQYVMSYFDGEQKMFEKVGQYPSIADSHISKIRQYNNILGKEKLKELTRAIGLAANGVGVGSFVYLRRIFECLVENSHDVAKFEFSWDEAKFLSSRMSEKIELLSNHLPSFLVENRMMYGISSKGIHELTEGECLEYFDVVKVGIELILDEKQQNIEKRKKIEDAQRKISNINSKLTRDNSI